MDFREITETDIEFVRKCSISRGIFSKIPDRVDYCYTLEHEGKVLAIGGISLINYTTAWGWIDLTEFAKEHIVTVYRTIKEWMDILCRERKIKRLMAYVECDFPEAINTINHLGFKKESRMPYFANDKPADLYVKFYGIRS